VNFARTPKLPADPHAGLRGEALRLAKEEGKSLRQQVREAQYTTMMIAPRIRAAHNNKEATMASKSTKQSSKRSGTSARKPKQPSKSSGIGIAEIAKAAGVEPKAVRIAARELGLSAGRGSRYTFPSLKSAPVKRLLKALAE
jgi:hypothetical protein